MTSPQAKRNGETTAFPDPDNSNCSGMTLREWYAGLALQGLMANGSWDFAARKAVEHADALLEELAKKNLNPGLEALANRLENLIHRIDNGSNIGSQLEAEILVGLRDAINALTSG